MSKKVKPPVVRKKQQIRKNGEKASIKKLLSIPPSLFARLEQICEIKGVFLTPVILTAIEIYIDREIKQLSSTPQNFDHIRDNNSIENLRAVNPQQNSKNI